MARSLSFRFLYSRHGRRILVRGYLLGKLSLHLSHASAIIISSLFFAALHLANPGITRVAFLELFLFGAIML